VVAGEARVSTLPVRRADALGDYDAASKVFRQIIRSGPEARGQFDDWCTKYVFDTLEAGRSWHPPDRALSGRLPADGGG